MADAAAVNGGYRRDLHGQVCFHQDGGGGTRYGPVREAGAGCRLPQQVVCGAAGEGRHQAAATGQETGEMMLQIHAILVKR